MTVKSNCSLRGIGAGEIQVQLKESGIVQSNWDKVSAAISKIKEITSATVSYEGWLLAKIDVGNMNAEKTQKVVKAIREQIVGIVEHKLEEQNRTSVLTTS